jgi:hypothetical protein
MPYTSILIDRPVVREHILYRPVVREHIQYMPYTSILICLLKYAYIF